MPAQVVFWVVTTGIKPKNEKKTKGVISDYTPPSSVNHTAGTVSDGFVYFFLHYLPLATLAKDAISAHGQVRGFIGFRYCSARPRLLKRCNREREGPRAHIRSEIFIQSHARTLITTVGPLFEAAPGYRARW